MIMGLAATMLGGPPMTTSTLAHLRPRRCLKGHRCISIHIVWPVLVSGSGHHLCGASFWCLLLLCTTRHRAATCATLLSGARASEQAAGSSGKPHCQVLK